MSQIQLGEGSEYNADDHGKQRDAFSPSGFQREILALSFDDFITNTNIKDLVLKEHRKLTIDENATLAIAAMHEKLQFYYDYCKRTQEWHKNSIKNLKFKPCKCTKEPQPEPSDANVVINDFQLEIMALSYEAFINETNIRDIVRQDLQNQFNSTKAMTEQYMEYGLDYFERLRHRPTKWHQTSMIHLKFNKCECKRKKQFEEKSVATDAIETNEIGCMTDFDTNKIAEPNQQQFKLATLTIHTVPESQIICISGTSDSNPEQEITAEEQPQGETFEFSKLSKFFQSNLLFL